MAITGRSQVMVTCKKCGQQAPADSFRLDYEYKTVVCPSCYSRKSSAAGSQRSGVQNVSSVVRPSQPAQQAQAPRTPIRNTTYAEDRGFKSASQAWKEREDSQRNALFGTSNSRVKNTPYFDGQRDAPSRPSAVGSVPVRNEPKAGWDKDDEFLELDMIKKREDEEKFVPQSSRLPQSQVIGPDVIAVKCYMCNYTFKFNTEKQSPKLCPNCGKPVDTSMF